MALFKAFGSNPSGKELSRMVASANYKNDVFQNLSETKALLDGTSYLKLTWRFLNKPRNTAPPGPLPFVKTDIKSVAADQPAVIWFGHSSYFIRINGANILVDPVFCGYASPFSFTGRSFKGSDVHTADDLPELDLLILTHDHYDHLDYITISKLRPKTRHICTSLGVGSHLRYWGIDPSMITEFDWWESKQVTANVHLTAAPARHFSGRSLTRNKTLWSSFVLRSGDHIIYIGGDSGYDSHFKTIGEQFGPFDIAMLETGQYGNQWPYIHMQPEETVQAAIDLQAKLLLPVHWGKFALAMHPWDEPIKKVTAKANELKVKVTTPLIGEPVVLGRSYPDKRWWEDL